MQSHVKAPLVHFEVLERRFDHVTLLVLSLCFGGTLFCLHWWIRLLGGQKLCPFSQHQLGTLHMLLLAPEGPDLTGMTGSLWCCWDFICPLRRIYSMTPLLFQCPPLSMDLTRLGFPMISLLQNMCVSSTFCTQRAVEFQGPFQVLESTDKIFVIDVGWRSDCVSIEHLKPAHIDLDQPTEVVVAPTSVNKSGQFVAKAFLGNSPWQVTLTRVVCRICAPNELDM